MFSFFLLEHEGELDQEFELETDTLFGGLKKVWKGWIVTSLLMLPVLALLCVMEECWVLCAFSVEKVECAVLVKASDLCSILLFWKYCAWVRASLLPLEREMLASPSAPTRNSALVSVLLLRRDTITRAILIKEGV